MVRIDLSTVFPQGRSRIAGLLGALTRRHQRERNLLGIAQRRERRELERQLRAAQS